MNHFVLKAMTPRVPAPGVEMRVINGEKMTMVFFKLEPGAGVPLHAHPHEQVGTVLKGSIEFVVADEKRIVREGEVYHVPSNVVHGGNVGSLPRRLLRSSPRREKIFARLVA